MTLSWSTNKTGTGLTASYRGEAYQIVAWQSGPNAGSFSVFRRPPRVVQRGKRKGEREWGSWFPIWGYAGSQMLATMDEAKALCEAETADKARR
jgi:hypothetical protein